MGLKEIRRLAHALGIPKVDQMAVAELIKSIQFEVGLVPCFSEAWSSPCRVGECPFSSACSSNMHIRAATKH